MSTNDVDKLAYACEEAPMQTPQTLIAKGNLRWFYGKPTSADKGWVALMLSNGTRVSVAKAEVVEAERDENGFWIGVNDGTAVLVEWRLPSKVGDTCDCSSQSGRIAQGAPGGGPLPEPTPPPFCRVRYNCHWYAHPDGTLRWFCVPWLECIPG